MGGNPDEEAWGFGKIHGSLEARHGIRDEEVGRVTTNNIVSKRGSGPQEAAAQEAFPRGIWCPNETGGPVPTRVVPVMLGNVVPLPLRSTSVASPQIGLHVDNPFGSEQGKYRASRSSRQVSTRVFHH